MAKKIGPKEAAMRAQRDGSNTEAAELLKQLEADEREAFAQFELEQRKKREKALEKVLQPLKARRDQISIEIADLGVEKERIDREIAKLTGQEGKGKGGKRTRQKPDQTVMDAILSVLPSDDFMRIPDAMAKAKLSDKEAVQRAVNRLKRDGAIKSNGKVGAGAAWKKVK